MSNKLLFITQVFYPDEVSTANLFTDLCSALVKENVDIKVWCAQPSYTNSKRQTRRLVFNGIQISYLFSTNFRKTSIAGRVMNYITFMTSVFVKLLLSGDKRPVMTHTTPPTLAIILSLLCSLKKRKYIQVLLDIFPEGLVRLGKLKRKNIFVIFWHKLFILSLRQTDKLIVIGRDMNTWIEKLIPHPERIFFIPLWQDNELISPKIFEENELVNKYNLKDGFVVQYSGNMGLWNDMKTIGKAVMSKPPGVRFVFIGDGMRKNELLASMENNIPSNVIMLPFQSKVNFSITITACHVALVSLSKGLEGIAVPSKIYGIMASGIPVIAIVPDKSEIALILEENKCGIVVEPGDFKGLVEAILLLKSDKILRESMGLNGRRAFENEYTTEKVANQYKMIISQLNNND